MPLVPCGCTSQYPVCETGQALFRAVDTWNLVVNAPDFPTCSVEVRDAVFDCYREEVCTYLSHCGCSVLERVHDEISEELLGR